MHEKKKMVCIKSNSLLWTAILGVLGFFVPTACGEDGSQPNIIVILTDDGGYSDFSCYGNKDYLTPNVDRIAADGIRFTNGYVSESVCSPSRAGLLTGRYQQRFGYEFNLPTPAKPAAGEDAEFMGLPVTETMLSTALQDAGYTTAAIGKWHLGDREQFHPNNRGFDHFYGFLGGSMPYFADMKSKTPMQRNGERVEGYPYLTEAFADESIRFMGDNLERPFFIYLAFNAVHGPLHAKQSDYDRLASIKSQRRRTYAAMHLSLDRQVGRILDYLDAENLTKNTLLFFINDNGGPLNMGARNGNLRGQKGTCMEGGIRVPFMVQWPGKIPAGVTYDKPVISLDIFTTALAAAGGETREDLDGVNLLPFLSGDLSGDPHERLYWRRSFYSAIREGEWKLVHLKDRLPMLFDLKNDPGERNDLAQQQRGRAQDLIKKLYLWETELEHPLWHTDAKYLKDNTEKHDMYKMSDEMKPKPTVIR